GWCAPLASVRFGLSGSGMQTLSACTGATSNCRFNSGARAATPSNDSASRRPPAPAKITTSALPERQPGRLITSCRTALRSGVSCAAPDCDTDQGAMIQPIDEEVRGSKPILLTTFAPKGGALSAFSAKTSRLSGVVLSAPNA